VANPLAGQLEQMAEKVTYARSKPATEGSFWKELIFIDFSYFG
jgi:hypothetical protein